MADTRMSTLSEKHLQPHSFFRHCLLRTVKLQIPLSSGNAQKANRAFYSPLIFAMQGWRLLGGEMHVKH